MKTFTDLNLQDLQWTEAGSFGGRQELRDKQGEVVASMKKQNWWRNVYEVNAPGNRWLIEPKGFWQRRIEIRSAGTGDLLTTFEYRGMSGGGELTLPDGRVFSWQSRSFWGDKWAWVEGRGKDEDPVLAFETGGFFHAKGDLSFDEDANFPSILIFLGWYLHTLQRQENMVVAAAVVVT